MYVINKRVLKRHHGKLFLTEDQAAAAFGCEALPLTAVDKCERGAIILPVRIKAVDSSTGRKSAIKVYTYGHVFRGGHSNVVFDVVFRFLIDMVIPRRVSFAHTHPFCTGHKPEVFSAGDELVARLPGVNYMYLASPAGCLYKYNGKNPARNKKGELILKAIETGLPVIAERWDCRHLKMPKKISLNDFIQSHDIAHKK